MFDELIREIRRLEGTQRIPVSISYDADGYFDRQCPSGECECEFKIHSDDWRDKVRDEEVFCPFCGHSDGSGEWCTEEQVKHIKSTAVSHVRQRIVPAMKRDAARWNRSQPRNSFIRITMMHMIRKGQARWVSGSDVRQQIQFINQLFEVAA